jgi:sialic acid synthase
MLFPGKESTESFVIAEVGQNHQGDIKIAEKYIDTYSSIGADAIKFQMRDNKTLFSSEVYNKEYNSENSFGRTYGEHREFLELSTLNMQSLRQKCTSKGVSFMVTPFDEVSLRTVIDIDVDILKVASFDLGNLPFLNLINETKKPVVISTGGGNSEHFRESLKVFRGRGRDVAVLHCVSLYPCPADKLRLNQVEDLIDIAQDHAVGLSDHYNGILSGPLAFMKGARVFEKHVSLDRSQKGTDHSFSLEPNGFFKFCRDIKRTPLMLDRGTPSDGSEPVFKKLGKKVVAEVEIKAGDRFNESNIVGRINGKEGIEIRDIGQVLGRVAKSDVCAGDNVHLSDVLEA